MSDNSQTPESAPAATPPPPKAQPAAKRDLPSQQDIQAWVGGSDLPTLAYLFDQLNLKRFDGLVMQIRKEELLPQHWQVVSQREVEDDTAFDRLPEVERLRSRLPDPEAPDPRAVALKIAWRELGGKQPSLWSVADVLVAIRRIINHEIDVDYHDLLSAVRDVWSKMSLPQGQFQLEQLQNVLAFVRQKTKK
ncbi:MAG: hypothetical protein P8Y44_00640 [Acidobacteriota bacterium]|jgi:hypothetical protein